MARTMLIGLRREPQPPIPMVMPSRSSATTSSSVIRLSTTLLLLLGSVGVALLDERVAQLVGDAREIELEGEPLLEPVRALDVPQIDAVEALLGRPHDGRGLRRDVGGHCEGSV